MVDVRVSRVAGEAFRDEGDQCSTSRVEVESAGDAREASAGDVLVSRITGEIFRAEHPQLNTTRVEVESAGDAREASAGDVLVSRITGEIFRADPGESSTTRVEVESAGDLREATTGDILVTRITAEVFSRQGSAGLVVPLALSADSDFFLHNWASGLDMRSAFQTSIKQSPFTGAESRRGLGNKPVRDIKFKWLDCDTDTVDRMLTMFRRMTDDRFQCPLYQDQQELGQSYLSTDTRLFLDTRKYRLFPGARVVIVQLGYQNQVDSWLYAQIDAIDGTYIDLTAPLGVAVAEGSLVIPVLDVEMVLSLRYTQDSAKTVDMSLEVAEVSGPSTLPPMKSDIPTGFDSHLDLPIFNMEPDWERGIKRGRSRQGKTTNLGRADVVKKLASRSRELHELSYSEARDEAMKLVEFFDTRRGALRSFWLTDQDQSMNIAEVDASGNFVSVSEIGDFTDFSEEWGYVGLVMNDGTTYVREVVNIQQVLTVFRLTVTPALPAGLDLNEVARVARARTTRFVRDDMRESWSHTGHMKTRLQFIEVLDENTYTL